ncbi:MAG: phosphoenolpyruvate carboxylase, partial [Gluconacetobacter diazotrophicus]|nr:phosphoenolpyruvate carboxylase [Gluconacetobacter diazotrophicus]
MEQLTARQDQDPFANPVLGLALTLSRRLDDGTLSFDALRRMVLELRDRALRHRAERLARYVGLDRDEPVAARLSRLAERLARPDPDDSPVPFARFRQMVERPRFAAVFTAHPTFALGEEVYGALAAMATGTLAAPPALPSHRRAAPTLEDEFRLATVAITRGRDALDRFNRAILSAGAAIWPQHWSTLRPRPIVLASWVGYDTDGRTDIGWWDTLRLRLRMKLLGLERLRDQAALAEAEPVAARLREACAAVSRQIEAAPVEADPGAVSRFAAALVDEGDAALRDPAELDALLGEAIAGAEGERRLELATARAGLAAHGLSLAHTHVRLNATQIHNVARQRLGIEDSPENPSQRRALLARINEALDEVRPVPVDFGAMLAEQATAARLMMTVAQIAKHVDRATPVRFLIAETESGYTLLVALWLARRFGIEDRVEISPLFETRDAMVNGVRVVEEALRSRHYRDYLRRTGRMALQFGYSDSGRYVGQLAATYLVERLRLKIADLLSRRGLSDIEVVLFDTHGESIGRGAHPFALADRLDYLSTPRARHTFAEANIPCREESAFQGGDGYLLFGSPELADAVIAAIAEHGFGDVRAEDDPIYDEPDFSSDFFS